MRYNPQTGVYRDCRWCEGKGCVSCKIEADKAYKKTFPDGPKPIASFDRTDPSAMNSLRELLSQASLQAASEEAKSRAESLAGSFAVSGVSQDDVVSALQNHLFNDVMAEKIQASPANQLNR